MPSPNTPAGPMKFFRSSSSIVVGLPHNSGGSAPAFSVSGPARRSLSLRPARSQSRLKATLSIQGFNSFIASTAAWIATGRSEPVPGQDFHLLWTSAFSRRTEYLEYYRNWKACNSMKLKAGDGDRTRDVQIGKLAFN